MQNVSSLSFNGTNQYVKLPTAASIRNLAAFTFVAFFKVGTNATDASKHHAYVERQGTGTGIRFRFTPVQGKLQFGFSPKDGVADTSYTYNTKWDDRWHLAAFTARLGGDNPSYDIILDGVRVADGTLVVPSGVTKISDTAPKGIYMGNHSRLASGESFPSSTAWHGVLDDVAMFNEFVGQGEINTYFSSDDHWAITTTVPEDTEFVAYYQLNSLTGSTVSDVSRSPARTGTAYENGVASSALWTIDRPFLGDGLIDTTPPSTPTANPHTNVTEDGFDTSWAPSTDNVWVQFYELQVSQFANFSTYSAYDMGRTTSKQVRGLLPSTNYYWRVRAFDAELNASGYSAVQSLTTLSLGDTTPPDPPTNLTATYLTHSSFRLTFTASPSNDVVGYKLDIASDSEFSNILTSYRNKDIGNTTVLDVFGLSALTSYYVRVRSYDAFDNESNDSVHLRVNTPRQPDITPPLTATLHEPIGITSRAATLEWDEGIDDVGVAGYYVDLSTDVGFTSYVQANNIYWNMVDVGNVTAYRVDGLEPDTTYYYRVRAYDDAGNIAQHVEEPMAFTTEAASIYEGGNIETLHMATTWKSGATVEPDIITIDASNSAKFEFPLDAVIGSLQSGILQFTPRTHPSFPTTLGNVGVRATAGTIDTVTSGATLTFNITTLDTPVDIDISSLLNSGATTYTVEVISQGFVGYLDSGVPVSGFNDDEARPPSLTVQADPMSSTRPLTLDVDMISSERINDCLNPSFEVNSHPWGVLGSAQLTHMFSEHYDGSRSLRISGTQTLTGAGYAASETAFMPTTSAGRTHTISLQMKSLSGPLEYRLVAQGFSPDVGYIGDVLSKDITLTTDWQRYFITFTTPDNGMTHYAPLIRYRGVDATWSMVFDYLVFEETDHMMMPFTGNSVFAEWLGAANESKSRMPVPTLRVQSSYEGDTNQNNEVSAYFRRAGDDDWISVPLPVETRRELQQHNVVIPPIYTDYNLVSNPSFEADAYWSGGTYDSTYSAEGQRSYSFSASMDSSERIACQPSFIYTAQARVRNAAEVTSQINVRYYTANMTPITTFASEGVYSSVDGWTLETHTFITPATAAYMSIGGLANGQTWFDCVQINEGSVAYPYRDGSSIDGIWNGEPELSRSSLYLLPETDYEIMFMYYDPDGFFDNTNDIYLNYVENYTTPALPDNAFSATELQLTAQGNAIDVALVYSGDDNKNATVRFEFKRTDLSTWSEFRPRYDYTNKKVVGRIDNLKHGTNYTVRAIITDEDGVQGALNNIMLNTITTEYVNSSVKTEPHISFGGFTLMGRDDTKIGVTSHDAFGFPTRRITIEDLPRLDGAIELQALWGRKEIRMQGFISGDSRADLENVRKSMLRALAPRQQRLVIDTLSHEGRFYNATVESLDIPEDAEEHVRHLNWTATFVCADPFAHDIAETTMPTFTAPNNSSISLVNDGDVITYPQFVMTTTNWFPVSITIVNDTTGERMVPKTTIISGDRLILDAERRSLTKNGVEIDYAGTFPTLAVGGNMVTFYLSTAFGTPKLSVDVRWRHKYL